MRIVSVLFLLAALAVPVSAQPDWGLDEGIQLGCSNTGQVVFGYRNESSEDKIVQLNQGSGAVAQWADPSFSKWPAFWSAYQNGGQGVWFQVCARSFGGNEESMPSDIASIVQLLSNGGILPNQIWISALQKYVLEGEPNPCNKSANHQLIEAAVDGAISAHGLQRGPELSAVGHPEWLSFDGCHLSDAGMAGIGQQMVNFFDDGVPPPPPPPPPAGDPLLVPVLEPLPECASEGWIAWDDAGVLWGCDGQGGLGAV